MFYKGRWILCDEMERFIIIYLGKAYKF